MRSSENALAMSLLSLWWSSPLMRAIPGDLTTSNRLLGYCGGNTESFAKSSSTNSAEKIAQYFFPGIS